ncbi:MAG TPA: PASTA domain-containing protein, partial [Roseiflexaceae bacterium]|nr:PASTA domain-containing protein [Roseiflexaceae bacterium]
PQPPARGSQPGARPAARSAAPAVRNPLPAPRSAAMAPAGSSGARDLGLFLLGMIVLSMVLFVVYLFASGTFDGLFTFSNPPRPTVPTLIEPTATSEIGETATPAPLEVIVPNAIGREERTAVQLFESSGLRAVADPPQNNDEIPAGLVFDQMPKPGEIITETSIVTYVVSLGPELITLPQVVSMRAPDAAFQLSNLGLEVRTVEEPDRLSQGFVFRTEPQAGVRLRPGDTVILFVSLGDRVRMPDVTGMTEDEARRRIEGVGLFLSFSDYQECDKLGALCDRFQPGEVVSSIPRSGDLVERGSGVTLGIRSLNP